MLCLSTSSFLLQVHQVKMRYIIYMIMFVTVLQVATAQSFTCNSTGRYLNPNSTDCSEYYLCVRDGSGIFIARNQTCPGTSQFNPAISQCTTVAFTCPNNVPSPGSNFTCNSTGRFLNPNSADCSEYYVCLRDGSGNFIARNQTCPGTSQFNPAISQCTNESFSCPNSGNTAENSIFTCNATGRFLNPNSTDCSEYFLCVRDDSGNFIARNQTCPGTSQFNPAISQCTTVPFTCPNSGINCTNNFVCTSPESFGFCSNGQVTGNYSCGVFLCDERCPTPCVIDVQACISTQ